MSTMPPSGDEDLRERSVGDLVKELSAELTTLVRQEIELAKALLREEVDGAKASLRDDVELAKQELSEKGKHAALGAGLFGAAGVAAVLALGTLTAFLIFVLDSVMKDWLAALIIALVWGAVAAFLVLRGRAEVEQVGAPVPQRAVQSLRADATQTVENLKEDAAESAESIKEDIEWAKTPNRSAGR